MKKAFTTYQKRYIKSKHELEVKRGQWDQFAKETSAQLKNMAEDLNSIPYYEKAYTNSSSSAILTIKNLNSVFFFLGKHSTGIVTSKRDLNTGTISLSSDYEDSGCLTFAQLPTGGVIVTMTPSKSQYFEWRDKYILLREFSSPTKIKQSFINRVVKNYLRYALMTAHFGKETLWDRFWIWRLKFRFSMLPGYIKTVVALSKNVASAIHAGIQ